MISGTLNLLVIWTVKEEDPIWVITMFRRIYHCRGGKVDRLREFVQAFLAVTHRLVYQVVPVTVVQCVSMFAFLSHTVGSLYISPLRLAVQEYQWLRK